jgi:hypothetical protein
MPGFGLGALFSAAGSRRLQPLQPLLRDSAPGRPADQFLGQTGLRTGESPPGSGSARQLLAWEMSQLALADCVLAGTKSDSEVY